MQSSQLVTHHTDDNTPYALKNNLRSIIIIMSMENTSVKSFEWFFDSQMKAYPDKSHFITSESKDLVI